MISAYYSSGYDTRELFKELKIAGAEDFEKNRNRFQVIKIDMKSEYQNTGEELRLFEILTREIKEELSGEFPDVSLSPEDNLAKSIVKIHTETGEQFVIIIDEYDVLVREEVPDSLFAEYLRFLNGLFKSATVRPAIALAYLTGILPIVRDRIQSKLNNFDEYTILDAAELSEYIGFTADEVKVLCDTYGMDYVEMKSWYDGYAQNGYEIYNPESVVKSIQRKRMMGFWSQTSTYLAILDRIRSDFEGIKEDVVRMVAGEKIDVNVSGFTNTLTEFQDKNDIYTYLIHIGYLAYDLDEQTCHIPNKEVRLEWMREVTAGRGARRPGDVCSARTGAEAEKV